MFICVSAHTHICIYTHMIYLHIYTCKLINSYMCWPDYQLVYVCF